MRRFEGKTALVVGGSRGIGAGIVRRLAAEGATVALTYSASAEAAGDLVREIEQDGGHAFAARADSADADALREAVARSATRLGGLDVLVVNAGILLRGDIAEVTLDQLDRILAVNVRGMFLAIQAAVPHLRRDGRVITIGSNTVGRVAVPGTSLYVMTKAAVGAMVRALALDLAPRGITINNLQPGPTETDMTSGHVEIVRNMVPLGRIAQPAEIAGFVAYLASAEAGYVTGASLTIDGGFSV